MGLIWLMGIENIMADDIYVIRGAPIGSGPGCIFSFAPGWTSGCTFSFNAPGSGIGALQGCIPDSECQPAATVELADMPTSRIKCLNRVRNSQL